MQILKIRKALLALGLKDEDYDILKYLAFFSTLIPVSTLYCLHVLPRLKQMGSFQTIGEDQLELDQEILKDMEKKIKSEWAAPHRPDVEFEIKEGHPLSEVLESMEAYKADFVVIGQQSDAQEHGILASQLIRKIEVDALVVPSEAHTSITHMLIPVDFSPYSVRALKAAAQIWETLPEKPRVTALNIFELPNLSVYKISRDPQTFKQMVKERKTEALDMFISNHAPELEEEMEKVVIEKDLPGIPQYLLNFAEEEKVDFVIMGAKGYSNIELLLIGSVTEKWLSKNQRIPTLVLK